MKDIALSIAHYAGKQGASHNGHTEFELSTKWVNAIASASTSQRIWVPTPGPLPSKVAQINSSRSKAAFELHFNACGGCGAKGCETLYYPGSTRGKALAEDVQAGLISLLGTKDRGVKEGWYKMDRPGVVDFYGDKDGDETPDYFLRKTAMPSLILEPFFIEELVDSDFDYHKIAHTFAMILEVATDRIS